MANSAERIPKVLAIAATTVDVQLNGRRLLGIIIGAGLTATALTFQSLEMIDGVATPVPIYDNNTARARTVAPTRFLSELATSWAGIQTLRIVFGTAQAGADCNLQIVVTDTYL